MISKVKIDGVTYNVEVTSETIVVGGRECKGSIDYNKSTIKIADFVGVSQAKVTLAHEIMHGMIYERGLSLKESSDETIVDELGKAFLQVVRDNKELIDLITSD
jgi:hypothetical protein